MRMDEHTTLVALMRARFSATPQAPAFMERAQHGWQTTTWGEAGEQSAQLAAALMTLGVARGDRIAIWGKNDLSWALCDYAGLRVGAATVGIYPSLVGDEVSYILKLSGCRVLIMECPEYHARILPFLKNLPELEHLISWDNNMGLLSLKELQKLGAEALNHSPKILEKREAQVTPSDLANLIFTSGTTGHHKGVCLTHHNLISQVRGIEVFHDTSDKILCFLPMAHVAERSCNHYARIRKGSCGAFVRDLTTIFDDAKEIHPTIFAAVPRVYEKVHERIHARLAQTSALRRNLFHWAISIGQKHHGENLSIFASLLYPIANGLVLRKLRALFGKQVRTYVCGAAPVGVHLLNFFKAAGVVIQEGYGLSESSGLATFNSSENIRFGSVGQPFPGVEVRIRDEEIQLRGDTIFSGYFAEAHKTEKAKDGPWLKTGDLGYVDHDGFVWITGRKKNVIITSGGKNVMPTQIEMRLLDHPLVSQVYVHGDRRKYLTAMIALEDEALDTWAMEQGIDSREDSITEHPLVLETLRDHVKTVNGELASYETIKDFRIMPELMTVENGLLTPTMKVKRKVVEDRYGHLLDDMYQE